MTSNANRGGLVHDKVVQVAVVDANHLGADRHSDLENGEINEKGIDEKSMKHNKVK